MGFAAHHSLSLSPSLSQLLSHPAISGSTMVVYLPSLGELAAIKQTGDMTAEKLTKVGALSCPRNCEMFYSLASRA